MNMADRSDEMAIFHRVIQRGSFAGAAEDSGLSPSAVSKLITRLESRLGVRLINRTTRRLALTHEGQIYFERSRDILRAIEAAEAEIAYPSVTTRTLARSRVPDVCRRSSCASAAGLPGPLSPHHIRFPGHEPVDQPDARQRGRRV